MERVHKSLSESKISLLKDDKVKDIYPKEDKMDQFKQRYVKIVKQKDEEIHRMKQQFDAVMKQKEEEQDKLLKDVNELKVILKKRSDTANENVQILTKINTDMKVK